MARLYHATPLPLLTELMDLSRYLMGLAEAPPAVASWDDLVELARIWHVAGKLWHSGDRTGRLSDLPPAVAAAFHAEFERNRARNLRVADKLCAIASGLNAVGVTPVLLKGSAYIVDPVSGDAATRYMHDIDFSILELDRLARTDRHLLDMGLAPVDTRARRRRPEATYYHYPALVDPATGIEVELHKQPFRGISDPVLDLYRRGLVEATVGAATVMLPSREFRFLHTVIHAQEAGKSIFHAYFNPRYLIEGLEYLQAMTEAERRRVTDGRIGYGVYLGSWLVLLDRFLRPPFAIGFEPGPVHGLQYRRIVRRGGFPSHTTTLGQLAWRLRKATNPDVNRRIGRILETQA